MSRLQETWHRILYLAKKRGWQSTEVVECRLWVGERGPMQVRVEFTRGGAVHYAWIVDLVAATTARRWQVISPPDRDKAATVISWLTEPSPGARRSTSNANVRGNSAARRRRRQWLVDEFGDGVHVACHMQSSLRCERFLTVETVSADRIQPGGSYERGNIQPGCGPCQREQGGQLGARARRARQGARQDLTPMANMG